MEAWQDWEVKGQGGSKLETQRDRFFFSLGRTFTRQAGEAGSQVLVPNGFDSPTFLSETVTFEGGCSTCPGRQAATSRLHSCKPGSGVCAACWWALFGGGRGDVCTLETSEHPRAEAAACTAACARRIDAGLLQLCGFVLRFPRCWWLSAHLLLLFISGPDLLPPPSVPLLLPLLFLVLLHPVRPPPLLASPAG